MPAAEARERVGRVKSAITQAREDLVSLWRERAWVALGYASWDELCDTEFGVRMALPRNERREVVNELRREGMSTRAIGSALGVHGTTVVGDLKATAEKSAVDEPETVTSLDGRQRPASFPPRTPPAPAVPVPPAVPLDRYPELQHYADRPEKAATLAAALDGYDDDERAVRREALAATIAAEQRNGGPVSYLQRDLDIEKADALFVTASQAVRAIQTAGGPGLLARVADRMDPLTRDGWAQTYTALAEHARAMAVAITSPSHLRSVQ